MKNQKNIRNFSIIAHINHGKSTLADRLIQACGGVSEREFYNQLLDNLYLEQERGITIKSQAITLPYKAKNQQIYELNLIDTPGHVDFSYEVSRSLSSCEGVLLLIDASQGIEAQTLANFYLALEYNLTIIPVINKIDLPTADIETIRLQIAEDLGLNGDEAIAISAKEGFNIKELQETIITKLPPPDGNINAPLQALIFDAQYDPYRGAIISIRVKQGRIVPGDLIRFMHTNHVYKIEEVGLFGLKRIPSKDITAGQVGYIIAGIKTISSTNIGDTITNDERPATKPLPGFKKIKPVVFSSIYPVTTDDYPNLADAIEKLKLNDASLTYQKETSLALGYGFRCGFLGLLHIEIIQERLEREFGLSVVLTVPSVHYHIYLKDKKMIEVNNPSYFPDPISIEHCEEPYIKAKIFIPERYIGTVMNLCLTHLGTNPKYHYLNKDRIELIFELPLAQIIYNFYDNLKTITQGYGSFDYELIDYRFTDLVKLDILVNGEKVDALSCLVHREHARTRALHAVNKLKETIPRQQFKIAIQGAVNGAIIARSTISAFRKDVTAKCYGGDISRKRKLLEKQKKGKKRMKLVGSVPIPQKAFLAVLQTTIEKPKN